MHSREIALAAAASGSLLRVHDSNFTSQINVFLPNNSNHMPNYNCVMSEAA